MSRKLTVCGNCGYENYFKDVVANNCQICNSPLTGNVYSVELLDKFTEAVLKASEKFGYSFDESVNYISENLVKLLKEPIVSENLLEDSRIQEILQPPKP
ncbi:hypothetical protein [Anabaena sp. UHCC 0451]|uniref:hypothetical protein n=1 Tax=Anabaena sp. UHCC 0451 TaxID=2055235 RepID=UPI002B215E57|nr:hypothetical protein [Anabaena sp. UHCC 0451]MEA5578718.1 hypothetical protein [Anabaena sp. UHCC 0451]